MTVFDIFTGTGTNRHRHRQIFGPPAPAPALSFHRHRHRHRYFWFYFTGTGTGTGKPIATTGTGTGTGKISSPSDPCLGLGLGWATGLGLGWLTWSRSRSQYTSGLGLGKEILVSVDPFPERGPQDHKIAIDFCAITKLSTIAFKRLCNSHHISIFVFTNKSKSNFHVRNWCFAEFTRLRRFSSGLRLCKVHSGFHIHWGKV